MRHRLPRLVRVGVVLRVRLGPVRLGPGLRPALAQRRRQLAPHPVVLTGVLQDAAAQVGGGAGDQEGGRRPAVGEPVADRLQQAEGGEGVQELLGQGMGDAQPLLHLLHGRRPRGQQFEQAEFDGRVQHLRLVVGGVELKDRAGLGDRREL